MKGCPDADLERGWTAARTRGPDQLLAGLRGRPVDAAARHHLPDFGLHRRPVLPVPRTLGPRHRARPSEPPNLRTDRSSLARALEPAQYRGYRGLAADDTAGQRGR